VDRDHRGAVETARDGTLFLDEIGELPISLQVKLLRFLQSGEVRPVGSDQTLRVPTRVVAATNRDLRADVEAGRFREDFYYRLAAYEIELPPLRNRQSDIPALVEHFRRRHQDQLGLDEIQPAGEEVLIAFREHPWPGNVRELEHVVQRAIVDSASLADAQLVRALLGPPTEAAPTSDGPSIGDDLALKDLEKLHIEAVLRRCGGNRTRAAEILGIERKSLYRKAERFGIALDSEGETP